MFIVRKNHKHIRLAERQLRNALLLNLSQEKEKTAVVYGDLLHQANIADRFTLTTNYYGHHPVRHFPVSTTP